MASFYTRLLNKTNLEDEVAQIYDNLVINANCLANACHALSSSQESKSVKLLFVNTRMLLEIT